MRLQDSLVPAVVPAGTFRLDASLRNLLLIVLLLLCPSLTEGAPKGAPLPAEFGRFIFDNNPGAPVRLFVIAMGHPDLLTGEDCPDGPVLRRELLAIGRWVEARYGLDLIFPEAYFDGGSRMAGTGRRGIEATAAPVEARLAELSGAPLRQVDEASLYRAVTETRQDLEALAANPWERYLRQAELEYLQRRRTLRMLDRAAVHLTEAAAAAGGSGTGLLTMGLAHVADAIDYAASGRADIPAPPTPRGRLIDVSRDLAAFRGRVGLSVIVPRSLTGHPACPAPSAEKRRF